jgi:hypothetical protein
MNIITRFDARNEILKQKYVQYITIKLDSQKNTHLI